MPTVIVLDKTGLMLESHEITGSFLAWLKRSAPSYRESARPPYSATLNGKPWPYELHDSILSDCDVVTVTVEPGWAAVPYIIAILAAGYSYYVASNIPQGYEQSADQGGSIYAANTRANSVKPSGIIREMAGRMPVYPDLICPPHRKYIDHEEFLYLNLAITRGYCDVSARNIYIAETPAINYSADIDFQISDPAADISGHLAHENWYESKEASGIQLVTSGDIIAGAWTVDYSGSTITSYLSSAPTEFPFPVDADFEIIGGSNPGLYRVVSLAGVYSETATVIGLIRAGGDTGSIEVLTQVTNVRIGKGFTEKRRNIFSSTGAPSLLAAVGESVTWQALNGGIKWYGPYSAIPTNESARFAEVDITFPRGLVRLNSDNEESPATVDFIIQWRERGTTVWTTEQAQSFTAATFQERGITIDIDFGGEINPEFRFRRVSKDSEDLNLTDFIEIARVKCKLISPTSYENITTMQFSIRGSSALAESSESRINIRGATRKLPTLLEVQDAANGSPFDLSGSATKISQGWILDAANFVSTGQLGSDTYYPAQSVTIGYSCDFSDDGLKMVIYDSGRVKMFRLTSPFVTYFGVTYVGYFDAPAATFNTVRFSSDTRIYTLRKQGSPSPYAYITEWTLSSFDDPNSAVVAHDYVFDGVELPAFSTVTSIYISDNGLSMWAATTGGLFQYDISTAYDVSTASYSGKTIGVPEIGLNDISGLYFGDNLTRAWLLTADELIYPYSLGVAGDISTAVYDGESFDYANAIGGSARDLNVFNGVLVVSSASSVNKPPEPQYFDGFVSVWQLTESFDTRASRSAVRFVVSAIYDALGADIINQVDFSALDALDSLLESRGDHLDAEFVDETTLWEAIKIMLSVGYSEPVIKEGFFTAVRVASGSEYNHLYTPDIMTGDGLSIESSYYDSQEPDGVDVEYFDETTNSMEVVEYRLPGDLGLRPKRVQSIGITNELMAWRFGARERRRLRAKPDTYTFTTELDALNSNYGDADGVASDVFGGQYGQVLSASGSTVVLDFDVVLAGSDLATFRKPDGSMSEIHTIIAGGAPNEIELVSPSSLSFTPIADENQEPTLATIGTTAQLVKRVIIRRIEPQNNNEVQVTAEEYVADIYADDDNSPS